MGERFEHAQLIVISRSSYLISNKVRIPIFGQQIKPKERTEESISKKGYLLMKDAELYSQRIRGPIHKYKLDPNSTLNFLRNTAQVYSNNVRKLNNGGKMGPKNANNLETDHTGTMIATLGGMLPPGDTQLQSEFMQNPNQSTRQYNQTLASEAPGQKPQSNIEVKVVGSPTKQTQPTVSMQPKGAEEAFSVLQKAQQESNLQMGQP